VTEFHRFYRCTLSTRPWAVIGLTKRCLKGKERANWARGSGACYLLHHLTVGRKLESGSTAADQQYLIPIGVAATQCSPEAVPRGRG
jgi:hypothetical protein